MKNVHAMMLYFTIIVIASVFEVNSKDIKSYSEIEDLVNFIDLLNNPDSDIADENIGKSKYLEDAVFKSSIEKEKMNELMRLLQKNYDAKMNAVNQFGNGERLHLISNPEMIDEYRNYLKKRHSPEMEYDEENEERTLKELLKTLRRNSVASLKKDGNLPILRIGANIRSFESQEKPQKEFKFEKNPVYDVRDTITEKYSWDRSLEAQKERKWKRVERDFDRPKPKNRPKVIQDELIYRKPKGRNGPSFGRTSIPFAGKRGVFDDVYK